MWDVVCVTCPSKDLTQEIHKEMELFRIKGVISKNAELLVVEDPRHNIGSGGATFNAILSVAESLSSQNGYSGNRSEAYVGGRAFMTLPCLYSSSSVTTLVPNFIHTYLMITNHVAVNSPPGVWVTSTDMIATISEKLYQQIDWSGQTDMLGLAVPMPVTLVAERHGVYKLNHDNILSDLWYKKLQEQLETIADENNTVPTLLSIVFLRPWVAESILSFYELYPLNACTYFGVDSGNSPINLSLFIDVMRAAGKDLTKEEFIGAEGGPVQQGKALIYDKLHNYNYHVVVDYSGKYIYPERETPSSLIDCFQQFIDCPIGNLAELERKHSTHSVLKGRCHSSSFLINSYIGKEAKVDASSILSHTIIDGCDVLIGRKCIINGLALTPEILTKPIRIPDELVFTQHKVNAPSDQMAALPVPVLTVFGVKDRIMEPVNPINSTFCNIPWRDYLTDKGMQESDIWPSWVPAAERTIFTARFFPLLSSSNSLNMILWLSERSSAKKLDTPEKKKDHILLESWRSAWRFSIKDLVSLANHAATFQLRQKCFARVAAHFVEKQLANKAEAQLTSLYNASVIDGFASDLVKTIDAVALTCSDEIKLARIFANIAALLGCMSGGRGGIRSGPAGNVGWRGAYKMLRNGQFEKAVRMMTDLRSEWMTSPQLIIRAARHYEGAQQTLISKACTTALNFVFLRPGGSSVPLGQWVVVESPCRADFAGGWSDTPPVCYELGGAVVGAAIKIEGKMPIGSKVRKLNKSVIKIGYLDSNGEAIATWSFDCWEQLSDYNSPFSDAALAKACLVAAGVIPESSPIENLAYCLKATVDASGLEIYTWSNLPRGSGLGTSSILAGTLIAALWTIRRLKFDIGAVIHAVLHFEQLLTTGGGWQDQVHGLVGGLKFAHSAAGLPVNIKWRELQLDSKTLASFNKRFLLIYSGTTRLAKNILQNVLRNWYSNDPVIVNTEKELIRTASKAAECLEAGDIDAFGSALIRSYSLKNQLAPGSETDTYLLLIEALKPIICGHAMAGAGGGGFVYFILKDGNSVDDAKKIMENTLGLEGCEIYNAEVAFEGMTIKSVA